MKRNTNRRLGKRTDRRRGSTLLIVLALLGLLAFTGMVFYTFSAQERAAAEYFSEAAKSTVDVPDDPFPWALKQLLTGADDNQKASILWSPRRRHAMLQNVVGHDTVAHSDSGINVGYSGTGLPVVLQDLNNDGTNDTFAIGGLNNPLNYVDSLAAWAGTPFTVDEPGLFNSRGANATIAGPFPGPGVDYTYPDINNIFLAHRGWAIRDNGAAHLPDDERYQRVPVFIPSFMRPALMKSSTTNGPGGTNALMDVDWYDHSTATGHPEFSVRSMRPSEHHIAGFTSGGAAIRRYLDATNPADAGVIAGLTHGAFPLRPSEGVNTADFGKLGVFTGHDPGTAGGPDSSTIQLDSDNDGDSIREGIWLGLDYPIQETTSGTLYATLFSFTIYDLDSLIDLNSHGNISELVRVEDLVPDQLGTAVAAAGRSTPLGLTFLSASNQGLGPNEVSPLWALAPPGAAPDSGTQFTDWYTANPTNRLEQANMEWLWLLTGRIDSTNSVFDGRWGDANALWYHRMTDPDRSIWSLPRPGRAGNLVRNSTASISFGGKQGFDDNQNALEGIAHNRTGVIRGFMHPLDVGGTGMWHGDPDSISGTTDPRVPLLSTGDATRPEQWLQYEEYPIVGTSTTVLNDSRFLSGRDQNYTSTADNQYVTPRYNMAFEDALEFLNDVDRAVHPDDQIFRPSDLVPAHLASTDITSAQSTLSSRLSDLAPFAFDNGSTISDRFTTITNSLRTIIHRHDLGLNLLNDGGGTDDGPRWWEWTSDFDGDGRGEFPPSFGPIGVKILPYTALDPFRKVTRRLLTSEAGEARDLISQLPLSVNHILDVNRTSETPPETSAEFLPYMLRTGMRLRPITEHPDTAGFAVADHPTTIPTVGTTAGTTALQTFPPRTVGDREFWARRDRQKLARDIYVLLYTLGGAQVDGAGNIVDYTVTNTPSSALGTALYTHDQLRRMAQFAVNMVDAMDTDDVVTMFEYDKNLGDGWNLDDDAFTNTAAEQPAGAVPTDVDTDFGMYPNDTVDRGIVFGVKAQQLSFSEVLAVRLEDFAKHGNMVADDAATKHADASSPMILAMPDTENQDRHVLHIELQNNQPYPVPLSVNGVTNNATIGNGHRAIWQLARYDRTSTTPAPGGANAPQSVFPDEEMFFMDGNGDVAAGGHFTVSMAAIANSGAGSTDPTGFGSADLYLSTDGSGTSFDLISPDLATGTPINDSATPGPRCDLDTVHSLHSSRHLYRADPTMPGTDNGSDTTPGAFLRAIPYGAGGVTQYVGNDEYNILPAASDVARTSPIQPSPDTGQGFEVVLRRRLNPNLPLLTSPDVNNPWVEVDRVRVDFQDLFNFDTTNTPITATAAFDQLQSEERLEPLDSTNLTDTQHPVAPQADNRYNTIASVNDRAPAKFTLYQPHFDRDFATTAELFQLPLVGPRLLTRRLNRMRYSPYQQVHDNVSSASVPMALGAGAPSPGDSPPRNPSRTATVPYLDNQSSAVSMFLQPEWPVTPGTVKNNSGNAWYRLLQYVEVPSRVNRMLGNYLLQQRLPGKLNVNGIRHMEVYAGLLDDALVAAVPTVTEFAPFMIDGSGVSGASEVHSTATTVIPLSNDGGTTTFRDRWFDFIQERDGATVVFDPVSAANQVFWVPGTPNARPFRSLGHRNLSAASGSGDSGLSETVFRTMATEIGVGDTDTSTNRTLLEIGTDAYHKDPNTIGTFASSNRERHQLASKILNNTTTISNAFIIYGTAAYFEATEDASGLIRVGGRMGLDVDGDGDEQNDPGWEQRSVFIVDRTELLNAYDEGIGSFDWQRLIKYRADLASDGQ